MSQTSTSVSLLWGKAYLILGWENLYLPSDETGIPGTSLMASSSQNLLPAPCLHLMSPHSVRKCIFKLKEQLRLQRQSAKGSLTCGLEERTRGKLVFFIGLLFN